MAPSAVLVAVLAVAAVAAAAPELEDEEQHVTMAQLNLYAPNRHQKAQVRMGTQHNQYVFGASEDGFFLKSGPAELMHINAKGQIHFDTPRFYAHRVSADELVLGGVPQFKMITMETFERKVSRGWSHAETLNCSDAGVVLLTGTTKKQDAAAASSAKVYTKLPPHTHLRFQGTANFVDDWQGETGYFKVEDQIVWTRGYDQRNAIGRVNVCGDPRLPEGQFSVPFDVTVPHTSSNVTVAFGSTASGSAAIFGLSSLSILTRNTLRH